MSELSFLKAHKWTFCMKNGQTGQNRHQKQVNWSELASPFHELQPKRIKWFNLLTTCMLTIWELLNKQVKKKCHDFQCPKTGTWSWITRPLSLQPTSLNLNVGHTAWNSIPNSKKLHTLTFLECEMKVLTMGPCNSPGTLQENVSNQFAELENENECVNKLSVKNEKGDLSNHKKNSILHETNQNGQD